jgi:hypothetical protein
VWAMEINRPDDWILALQPSPDWAIENKRTDAGWLIKARWWGSAGEISSEGPRQVIVQLAEGASPEVRQRGLNSGVLRRLERHLSEMTAEIQGSPQVSSVSDVARDFVVDQVAKLPGGPRDDPDAYYAGLLGIFQGLVDMGYPQPMNLMASVMDVPKDTLKTRLRKARLQRRRS